MDKAIDKLLRNCNIEIGYKADSLKHNKFAQYLDSLGNIYNGKKNGYDWCDIWVDAMFIQTFGVELGMKLLCQEYNGLGAGCKYSANYYKKHNQFSKEPRIGSQIFFGNDSSVYHTGIVEDYNNVSVFTIEGNSGNKVQAHMYSRYDKKIYGYGHPDWGLVNMDRYTKLDQIPIFYQPYVKKLIDKGYLNQLDLTIDMIRTMIVCGRMAGIFND